MSTRWTSVRSCSAAKLGLSPIVTDARATEFAFAAPHDAPIPYLPRIREYYQALGYGAPYEWAHYADVPFQPLRAPLSRCRIALITTAAPFKPGAGDQGPGAAYNAKAKFYSVYSGDSALGPRPAHRARRHRPPAHDRRRPRHLLPASRAALARRRRPHRVGCAAVSRCPDEPQPSRHAGNGLSGDRRALQGRRRRCRDPGSQLSRLPPDVSLVTIGAGKGLHRLRGAQGIVAYVGVPRLFPDYWATTIVPPQGPESQAFTLELALRVLETAPAPRTTVQSTLDMEREPGVEARLLQHRTTHARGNRPAAGRFRQEQGGGRKGTRENRISLRRLCA